MRAAIDELVVAAAARTRPADTASSDTAAADTTPAKQTAPADTALADSAAPADTDAPSDVTLRLGYFPNVTHAPAIIGVDAGLFQDALGSTATLETSTFNSGTEAAEAILSGALDATFIGPNPAINTYSKSDGDAIRIVAGTTSGGASLVVRDGIETSADLAGATLASPSLGNTQDVALRAWLAREEGIRHRTPAAAAT